MSKHMVVVRKIVVPDDFFDENLADSAAKAAAEYLIESWNQVLHEEPGRANMSDLLHDVDDVCKALCAWRDALKKELP